MKRTGMLITLLLAAACEAPAGPDAGSRISGADGNDAGRTAALFARSCALCHVNGEGGAPRMGDREAWTERVAQGEDVLLAHTLEGYGAMPPLGYCMACEEADFVALIDLMATSVRDAPDGGTP